MHHNSYKQKLVCQKMKVARAPIHSIRVFFSWFYTPLHPFTWLSSPLPGEIPLNPNLHELKPQNHLKIIEIHHFFRLNCPFLLMTAIVTGPCHSPGHCRLAGRRAPRGTPGPRWLHRPGCRRRSRPGRLREVVGFALKKTRLETRDVEIFSTVTVPFSINIYIYTYLFIHLFIQLFLKCMISYQLQLIYIFQIGIADIWLYNIWITPLVHLQVQDLLV